MNSDGLLQIGVFYGGPSDEHEVSCSSANVELLPDRTNGALRVVCAESPEKQLARIDVAFPVMHGAFGEDRVFQGGR